MLEQRTQRLSATHNDELHKWDKWNWAEGNGVRGTVAPGTVTLAGRHSVLTKLTASRASDTETITQSQNAAMFKLR